MRGQARIARRLDELGVAFIERLAQAPNPKDAEFFERARARWRRAASIAAFGSTCRVGGTPEDDGDLRALLDSGAPVCTVVGKTWTLHVTGVLRATLDENLRIIEQASPGCASTAGASCTTRSTSSTATAPTRHMPSPPWRPRRSAAPDARPVRHERRHAAVAGGEVVRAVRAVKTARRPRARRLWHRRRDLARGGARGAIQVQGTINGYGERCGNANLCSVIPGIELKCRPPLPAGGPHPDAR